eukprot:Pgem_evm1s12010
MVLALRTATLRHNSEGQSTIINLLLRNYIVHNMYDSAVKLISKCNFPDEGSNNEWARFHYYMGRTKAVRLEYAEAAEHMEEALRKAPQNAAFGFQQEVQKWLVVIQLLLGHIPDRSVFRNKIMSKSLLPYKNITL